MDHHVLIITNTVMVVLLNLVFGLSHRGCITFLAFAQNQLRLVAALSGNKISPQLADRLPKTLTTAIRRLNLEPVLRAYIACPKCYAVYPSIQPYPMYCTSISVPGAPACQSKLLTRRQLKGKSTYEPIKSFLHQDFHDWLGRFISRREIETIIRQSQEPLGRTATGEVTDILGSKVIREFCGPDGLPFLRSVAGEYRLVFALSSDGFNPLTNKEAKQVRSSNGIYLICLNLPLALRQHPHNIYLVGVVPGPKKFKDGEINHYLDLVVDDFLPLWDRGARLSATSLSPDGVNCLAAILSVFCDALGAREASGFPPITAMPFCIPCKLPIRDIENIEFTTWERRTDEQHRQDAETWRTADGPTRLALASAFHPARYSALLRLPYFQPVTFTITDSMHNLFLGLFQRHCRNVWGMNVRLKDGDGTARGTGTIPAVPSPEEMEPGRVALASGDPDEFRKQKVKRAVLYYLCAENNLRRAGKKADLLKELKSFVSLPISRVGSTQVSSLFLQMNELRLQGSVVAAPVQVAAIPPAQALSTQPAAAPLSQALPFEALPTLTRELGEKILIAEDLFVRGLSLKSTNNPPLRFLCYLRGLEFQSASPIKSDMISALNNWVSQCQFSRSCAHRLILT